MHENGFMTPRNVYVHAASSRHDSYQRIAATGGSVAVRSGSMAVCVDRIEGAFRLNEEAEQLTRRLNEVTRGLSAPLIRRL